MRAVALAPGAAMAGLAACVLAAAPAGAQGLPTFPPSLEREPLLGWLRRETDITADRVIAVTPQALTAVVSTFPAGAGQGPRVVIRAEALNGETYARTGALSWHVSLIADCAGHRVRLGDTTGYPERNLLGTRRVLRAAETDWRAPEPGTALDHAWRSACDTSFVGPFQAASVKVAQNDTTRPPTVVAAAQSPPPRITSPPPVAVPPPAPKAVPRTEPGPRTVPPAAGGVSVQVGAYPDQASARAALGAASDGRAHVVERALVNGRTWYRAVVSGFPSTAEAQGYCASRKATGGACFVRGARPN